MIRTLSYSLAGLTCLVGAVVIASRSNDNTSWHRHGALVVLGGQQEIGRVRQGAEVDLTFEVRNDFSHPVQLGKVEPTCNCTDGAVSRHELAPGETATVTARWKLGRSRGAESSTILVWYSPGIGWPARVLERTARANVIPDVAVSPERITFGPGQREAKVRLAPDPAVRVAIESVRTTHPGLHAQLRPDNTVNVTLDPDAALPWRDVAVQVVTTSKAEPVVIIPVDLHGRDQRP